MTAIDTTTEMWTEVCDLDTLTPDRGVAALLDGVPVAVFRLSADVDSSHVVAVDHVDPVSGVGVMARGLVGSVGVRDVVVSPLLKQRFDLHTGECLDDPGVWLRTWPVRVADGRVLVGGVAPPAGG